MKLTWNLLTQQILVAQQLRDSATAGERFPYSWLRSLCLPYSIFGEGTIVVPSEGGFGFVQVLIDSVLRSAVAQNRHRSPIIYSSEHKYEIEQGLSAQKANNYQEVIYLTYNESKISPETATIFCHSSSHWRLWTSNNLWWYDSWLTLRKCGWIIARVTRERKRLKWCICSCRVTVSRLSIRLRIGWSIILLWFPRVACKLDGMVLVKEQRWLAPTWLYVWWWWWWYRKHVYIISLIFADQLGKCRQQSNDITSGCQRDSHATGKWSDDPTIFHQHRCF